MNELFKLIEHCCNASFTSDDYNSEKSRAARKAQILKAAGEGQYDPHYVETLKRQIKLGWITKEQAREMLQNHIDKNPTEKEMSESVLSTEITDMSNNLIARMLDLGDVIELRTPSNKPLGRYVKATNTTTDMMNNALAKGNVLVTLIKKQ